MIFISRKIIKYYYVLRRKSRSRDYLEDVWEEFGDGDNFSFTKDISKAMRFSNFCLNSSNSAPKYLWDDINQKDIQTVEEMCEFFNGEIVEVEMTTIWAVKQTNPSKQ